MSKLNLIVPKFNLNLIGGKFQDPDVAAKLEEFLYELKRQSETEDIADSNITYEKMKTKGYAKNYISNGGFEQWDQGISITGDDLETANFWVTATDATLTVEREATTIRSGEYGMKVTFTKGGGSIGTVVTYVRGPHEYKGKKVVFSCWIKCATANRVRLRLYDGVNTRHSPYHTGSDNWERLHISCTLDSSATMIQLRLVADTGDSVFYADEAHFSLGTEIIPYTPYPAGIGDKIVWMNTPVRVLSASPSGVTSSWTDLNLSANVSAKAKFVILEIYLRSSTAAESWLAFRRNGSSATLYPRVLTQVVNIFNENSCIVACDSNKIVEYRTDVDNVNYIVADLLGFIEQD